MSGLDGAIEGDNIWVPVKVAPKFKEFAENIQRRLQLIRKIIEDEKDQHIEGIGCHARSVWAKKTCLVSKPSFQEKNRLLQKAIFLNKLGHKVHKV